MLHTIKKFAHRLLETPNRLMAARSHKPMSTSNNAFLSKMKEYHIAKLEG